MAGSNNAPTMAEFINNTRIYSITKEAESDISKGNCTRIHKTNMIVNETPLPKRKRNYTCMP
jgi:hypothetical protein